MKMINTLFSCCGWGRGGGGLWEYKGGYKPFTCHSLHSRLLHLFSWPPPSSSFLIAKYYAFLHNFPHFPRFPPIRNSPSHHFISFLLQIFSQAPTPCPSSLKIMSKLKHMVQLFILMFKKMVKVFPLANFYFHVLPFQCWDQTEQQYFPKILTIIIVGQVQYSSVSTKCHVTKQKSWTSCLCSMQHLQNSLIVGCS